VAIEALDGAPFSAFAINFNTIISGILGQQTFNEEFLLKPGTKKFKPRKVEVKAGETVDGIDHTTSVDTNLDGFDTLGVSFSTDWDGLGFFNSAPGTLYAVQLSASEVTSLLDAGLLPKGAAFRTFLAEASVTPVFRRASLVTGAANGDTASVDLDSPLFESLDFVGQDNDYSPLFFDEPAGIGKEMEEAIADGEDLFLVLELPEAFDGNLALPPFVGLDAGQIAGLLGRSYISSNGGVSFVRSPGFNFMFRVIFGEV
jgi:hypothetical protein